MRYGEFFRNSHLRTMCYMSSYQHLSYGIPIYLELLDNLNLGLSVPAIIRRSNFTSAISICVAHTTFFSEPMARKKGSHGSDDKRRPCSVCHSRKTDVEFPSSSCGLKHQCKACRVKLQQARVLEKKRWLTPAPANATQTCRDCGATKLIVEFPKNLGCRSGFGFQCKMCINGRRILRTYGITEEERQSKLRAQGHRCAICKKHESECGSLCVDHDHRLSDGDPDAVRDMLCFRRNKAIDDLDESPSRMIECAAYIQRWHGEIAKRKTIAAAVARPSLSRS